MQKNIEATIKIHNRINELRRKIAASLGGFDGHINLEDVKEFNELIQEHKARKYEDLKSLNTAS